MSTKRNHKRPDPAAQDPMDYLLGDVMAATDQIVAELRDMENLQADPLATLAGHCANLGGRVAALAEVVRQMRDQQRGLVVISDPEQPEFRQITEPELVAAQAGQAARTLVRWRMGSDGLEPVYADQDLATDQQLAARRLAYLATELGNDQDLAAGVDPAEVRDSLDAGQPARRWTRAEALAEAERLGGAGGVIFLMHWQKSNGGQ